MLLDTQAIYVATTDVGFRSYAAGALPATWTMNTGDQTPRDLTVVGDNLLGIGVCQEPTTAVSAPEALYNARQVFDSNYFRLRGILRLGTSANNHVQFNAYTPATVPISPTISVILVNGNVFGSGTSAVGLRLNPPAVTGWVHFAVSTNQWYKFIYERVNKSHYLYGSLTGSVTLAGLPNDETLTLLITAIEGDGTYPNLTTVPLWAGVASSATAPGATNYSAVGDFTLEEFKPLPVAGATVPGVGGFPAPNPTPYFTYKNLRQAVSIYNNLVIGP